MQFFLILLTSLLAVFTSCSSQSKNELIQGTWKISETWNMNDAKKFEKNKKIDPLYAVIHNDMIILTSFYKNEVESYRYKILNDSKLIVFSSNQDSIPIKINELSNQNLEVELSIFGKVKWRFERIAL